MNCGHQRHGSAGDGILLIVIRDRRIRENLWFPSRYLGSAFGQHLEAHIDFRPGPQALSLLAPVV